MERLSALNAMKSAIEMDDMLKAGQTMIVFDLETTGVRQNDRIISISAMKIVKDSNNLYKSTGTLDMLLNPGIAIPKEATAVNGITDLMVAKKPKEREAFGEIHAFFGNTPNLCGYSSKSFDERFLRAMYKRNGQELNPAFHLDVYAMAKEKLDLKSYKLQEVTQQLGVDRGLTFHRSMDDVIAAFRCMCILLIRYREKEKKKYEPVIIQDVRYWEGPSADKRRIYLTTLPRGKTYYDIYRKEWLTDIEDANLEDIRKDALYFMKANNESELVKSCKQLQQTANKGDEP